MNEQDRQLTDRALAVASQFRQVAAIVATIGALESKARLEILIELGLVDKGVANLDGVDLSRSLAGLTPGPQQLEQAAEPVKSLIRHTRLFHTREATTRNEAYLSKLQNWANDRKNNPFLEPAPLETPDQFLNATYMLANIGELWQEMAEAAQNDIDRNLESGVLSQLTSLTVGIPPMVPPKNYLLRLAAFAGTKSRGDQEKVVGIGKGGKEHFLVLRSWLSGSRPLNPYSPAAIIRLAHLLVNNQTANQRGANDYLTPLLKDDVSRLERLTTNIYRILSDSNSGSLLESSERYSEPLIRLFEYLKNVQLAVIETAERQIMFEQPLNSNVIPFGLPQPNDQGPAAGGQSGFSPTMGGRALPPLRGL